MKNTTVVTSALLLALLSSFAQAQKLSDAFIDIKERDFRKKYKSVAMMPVRVAPVAALPDAMKQVIIDEVMEYLEDEDFEVLPLDKVMDLQAQLTQLYPEPISDQSKAAIAEHTQRELFYRHPVDGIVEVVVLAVAAPFQNDKAEWGGTTQKIEHKGDGFFGSIMGKDYGGHIAASSIRVSFSDRYGKPEYFWSGGVEVMMQRNADKLEPLPPEALWQDNKRVLRAVKYAFKPF